jgi:glycosyltransferase involved in cell wall biosynthesis
LAGTSVAEWRSEWAELLAWADRVFAPSRAAADLVAEYIPGISDRVLVQPHGIAAGPEPEDRPPGRNVVVLGYGGTHKGDSLLGGVIEALAGRGIRWHLFGRKRLSVDDRPDVNVYGPYDRDDLPRLLHDARIDAALLLSPWPETYSYTLSEAWRQGIPVFGSDLGAIGERIRAEGGGVAVDPFDTHGAAAAIAAVLEDPDEMHRLAVEARAAGRRVLTLEAMADAYDAHYRSLAPEIRPARPTPFPVEPDELEIAAWMGSFRSPAPD